MADKMTLIDVRDWHRFSQQAAEAYGHDNAAGAHKELADALDAHIAAMGEPAGEVFGPKAVSTMVALANPLPPGTKLYAAQPASGDWDKVREVIAILDADGDEWGCAAKLTAALPENAK